MSLSLLQCYQDDDDESDELNEFIEARTLVPLIGNFSQDRHSQTVNPHIEQSSQLFVSTSQPPTRKREANSLAKVSNGDKWEPNNGLQEFKRVRTFDHEVGNWSSFFYVPYPNFEDLYQILRPHLSEFESCGFHLCNDFHISLSRTIVLKYFMIDAVFLAMKPLIMSLNSTQCLLAGVKPYENNEKTTSFLSVTVATGSNLMNKVIDLIDKKVCDFYKFPRFYKDRDLHMSVFWKNGPIDEVAHRMATKLDQILDQCTAEQGTMYFSAVYDDVLTFDVEEVNFKSGCKTLILPLNSTR